MVNEVDKTVGICQSHNETDKKIINKKSKTVDCNFNDCKFS